MSLLAAGRAVKILNMSLQERNRFAPQQSSTVELVYPSEFHLRIIVEAQAAAEPLLVAVLDGYRITAPLAASRQSSGGHYQAYGLSVRLESREEQCALVDAIKRVPGVRMVL